MYGEGISKWGELVDLAVQLELINKSGSWFSIGDERIGQGRDNAKQYLIDHPDVADRIEQSRSATICGSCRARTQSRPPSVGREAGKRLGRRF